MLKGTKSKFKQPFPSFLTAGPSPGPKARPAAPGRGGAPAKTRDVRVEKVAHTLALTQYKKKASRSGPGKWL